MKPELEKLRTPDEVRALLFSADSRPTARAFQRMARELNIPCVKLGRKILYRESELQSYLDGRARRPRMH